MDFSIVNEYVERVEHCREHTLRLPRLNEPLKVGLDLGTCFTVLVVLDSEDQPLACEIERSNALKDGVVVDYLKACQTVKKLKEQAEDKLGVELTECVIAMPPGTERSDSRTHSYVASSSGLEVVGVIDEPTAANILLGLVNGAVVDIGGGTTGISLFQQGRVVKVADQPTGGTHLTLVLAGNRHMDFDTAEGLKLDPAHQAEVLHITTPVLEKMSQIILDELRGFDVTELCLLGGTCCLTNMEQVIAKYTGLPVFKPANPLLITPIGIALAQGSARCQDLNTY